MGIEGSEVVRCRDGIRGVLEPVGSPNEAAGPTRVVRFDDGRRVVVSSSLIEPHEAGGYALQLGRDEIERLVVPLVEEQAEVGTRRVETGRVRVTKTVTERTEVADLPLTREEVDVERVAVNRVIDGPVEPRREGDTLIVPVVEEVLVVEKRLLLREELRITTRRTETRDPQTVTLRREEAVVERDRPGGLKKTP